MSEWRETRLGDVAEVAVGPPFKSAGFIDDEADGIRLLRGINVAVGGLRWSATKYWPRSRAADFSEFELQRGDVIVAMDRP